MVGRDDIDGAVRERRPNCVAMFGAPQRRIADVLRAVRFEEPLFGQVEIDGPRLGQHHAASGTRAAYFVDRFAARQVHEVGGRAGQFRHREGAADSGGLRQRRAARGEVRDVAFAGRQQALGAETDQVLVLGVNRKQRTAFAGEPEGAQVVAGASLETLHHEDLDTGDAAIGDARNFSNRFGRGIEQRNVKAVVDDRAIARFGIPLFERIRERAAGCLEGVVDDGRNAAGRGGRGARRKVVRGAHREHLGVEMRMRIDGARNQDHPSRVDGAMRGFERTGRCDAYDLAGSYANVVGSDARGRYYGCADDREIEHRINRG